MSSKSPREAERKNLVSAAGFEPAVTGIKIRRLDQLGDAPENGAPYRIRTGDLHRERVLSCTARRREQGGDCGEKDSEEGQKGRRENVETENAKEAAADTTG